MSAIIIDEAGSERPALLTGHHRDGDNPSRTTSRNAAPGQLWERAADTAPWPTAPDEAALRGPRFDLYRESPLASGVIRAGVRVLIK